MSLSVLSKFLNTSLIRITGSKLNEISEIDILRVAGLIIISIEGVFFFVWSSYEFTHFDLTWDFASYYQSVFLISRGILNPVASMESEIIPAAHFHLINVWQNHFELLLWPMASGAYFNPNGYFLEIIQAVATVMIIFVAFEWICDFIRKNKVLKSLKPRYLIILGLVLLVGNPWYLWSLSFDYHEQTLASLFCLLCAKSFYNEKLRAGSLWAVLVILTGDVGATYLFGVSVSFLLANLFKENPNKIRNIYFALALAGFTIIYIAVVHAIGGDQGAGLENYAYLVYPSGNVPDNFNINELIIGLIVHLPLVLKVLWLRAVNIYANLAPAGVIGILSPWGFGVAVLLILENSLNSTEFFSRPGFQSEPIYAFISVGTVMAIYTMAKRVEQKNLSTKYKALFSRLKITSAAKTLSILLTINTIIWAIIWYPRQPDVWLRVPGNAASVLSQIRDMLPNNAEVIVTQGVSGRFANRKWIYAILPDGGYGYRIAPGSDQWWIISPFIGTKILYTAVDLDMVSTLITKYQGKIRLMKDNIWAIETKLSGGKVPIVSFPLNPSSLRAFTIPTEIGRLNISGPLERWNIEATSTMSKPVKGYVDYGDDWQFNSTSFIASITLSSSVKKGVTFQLVDVGTKQVLWQHKILPTNGVETLRYPIDVRSSDLTNKKEGKIGAFFNDLVGGNFDKENLNNVFELRLFTPGGGDVKVYSQGLELRGL